MTTQPNLEIEKGPWQVVRKIVSILLLIETSILFMVAIGFGMFVLFMGGLAFLGGAGAASDDQIKNTWTMIFLFALAPFAWPTMLLIASINILKRKRPMLVAILCLLSIILEMGIVVWFYNLLSQSKPLNPTDNLVVTKINIIITLFVPLTGMIVALQMKLQRRSDSLG